MPDVVPTERELQALKVLWQLGQATVREICDAINRQGTANLVLAAAAAGVRHFVYVSSASVVYPRLTPYGQSKLAAEKIVAGERRLAHTIVRPTLVYDAGGGQEFMLFRKYLRRFPVVPFIGPGSALKRPVYSDDVVDGLARIAGNDACFGKTYNLSGAESISLADLGKLVLELEGATRPFLHVPVPVCPRPWRPPGVRRRTGTPPGPWQSPPPVDPERR